MKDSIFIDWTNTSHYLEVDIPADEATNFLDLERLK